MTINDIKATRTGARELYKRLPLREIAQAIDEPLRIGDLNGEVCVVDGVRRMYSVCLTRACFDSICSHYNRRDKMSDNELWYLSEQVVREFGEWKVTELRTFEHMLLNGRLPHTTSSGDEYGLVTMDIPGFMTKLRVYERKRPARKEEGDMHGAKSIEIERLEKIFKRRKSPYNCYGDYQRTHDAEGRLMPPGWDFEAYWHNWYESHYQPQAPVIPLPKTLADEIWEECTGGPSGLRTSAEAYAYWKSRPSNEELDEHYARIREKIDNMFNI